MERVAAQGVPVRIAIDAGRSVSGLLASPEGAVACYVFAHGAGAGMTHPFMEAFARDLAAHRIATLRYQFPYMERGSKRPDAPADAHAAVRAAAAHAHEALPALPLFAGGKSFGGRMTSQAQAIAPLPHVRGLAFVGFPLHPAGKPGTARADHLRDVAIPMLFLSGARDELADLALLRGVVAGLGSRTTLCLLDDADHALHMPARSGRRDPEVWAQAAATAASWMEAHIMREEE
ncbi:MAG: alpha/beta family hydrolase [Burkholderiales bacterium]